MKNLKILFLLFSIFLFNIQAFSQSYEIKINIKSLPNDTIILGHHFNSQLIPDDTAYTDKKGFATFSGKTNFPGGMYFLFLPNKSYFDFLLDKNQKFTIIADTSDFLNTVRYIGNDENNVFINYQRFLSSAMAEQDTLTAQYKRYEGSKVKQNEIKAKFEALNKKRLDYFNKVTQENPDFFFSKFLLATKQIEVPKTITDQKNKYYYYRNHYFDFFDVSDARLLRTPIYEEKIDLFMDKVISQHPDTLIKEADKLINAARSNDELFRYMLIHIFNKYASSQAMSSENVYVYLAEKYYIPEAIWSKPEFITDLRKKTERLKNCLIGNIAKDINFRQIKNDSIIIDKLISEIAEYKNDGMTIENSKMNETEKNNKKVNILNKYYTASGTEASLYNIKAEHIILWFWTPDCSHCRKETPEFHNLFKEKDLANKNVKVIAVYLSKDIDNWSKNSKVMKEWFEFIKKHEMYDWINVWSPFDSYRTNYDIHSSPVLYVLDKNYKIIAKRVGYEQAIEIIEKDEK